MENRNFDYPNIIGTAKRNSNREKRKKYPLQHAV